MYEFLKIDEVRFFEDDSCDLYDIAVEEDESFVLDCNVIVHNSGKMARDKNTQAILPLKGKVLNVEGMSINKILENQEIKNIISTTGVDIKKSNTDKEGLRYGRIIIMTDADVDGAHITALLLTLFYRYMKKLIDDGHIYIAKSPLYRVLNKNEIKYLASDEELTEYKKKHSSNVTVQRFKGLGEMNADQLYDTTMDINKRTLERVTIEDAAKADEILNILMGENASERKKYIMENTDSQLVEL
jgi:DNA gyrase subunit B